MLSKRLGDSELWLKEVIFERETEILSELPPESRLRIKRYRRREDRARSAFSEQMVRQYFSKRQDIPPERLRIFRDRLGRPYIPGESMDFNISHSGRYAAVVFSPGRVGLDIERIQRETEPGIEEQLCSQRELLSIRSSDCPEELFSRLWVLKESYLKARGSGFLTEEELPEFQFLGKRILCSRRTRSISLLKLSPPKDSADPETYYLAVTVL